MRVDEVTVSASAPPTCPGHYFTAGDVTQWDSDSGPKMSPQVDAHVHFIASHFLSHLRVVMLGMKSYARTAERVVMKRFGRRL